MCEPLCASHLSLVLLQTQWSLQSIRQCRRPSSQLSHTWYPHKAVSGLDCPCSPLISKALIYFCTSEVLFYGMGLSNPRARCQVPVKCKKTLTHPLILARASAQG